MTSAKPLLLAGIFSSIAWAGSAFAHVELDYPMPRALGKTEGNLKNTPCGQSTDGRTKDRVNVFAPGQTITLQFDEFIDHPSYYRVAFDPDGDTFPMRTGVAANTVETTAQAEAAEQAVFQGSGSQLLAVVPEVNGTASSATVTLPNMECENCTLQLIEFMYDKGDPNHGYFQCADIALRSDAAETGDGSSPDAGAPPASSSGLGNGTQVSPPPTGGETAAGVGVGTAAGTPSTNSGKGSAVPTATSSGGTATNTASTTGGSTPAVASQPQSMDSGGGCALSLGGSASPLGQASSAGGVAGLLMLGLGIAARRRR
jgi:hypothetical protein